MSEPRTIIVTGASSGIGAYCARALKRDGWRVFATARKPHDIEALAADGIEAFYLDYREPQSIEALVAAVLERTGGTLDALYNNGAHAQAGAVEDLPVEALREQFEANLFGWHDLTRRIVPVMRRQGHGRIVSCSSILGLTPARWRGAYVASKHALEGLMMTMRDGAQGFGHPCLPDRAGSGRIADRLQRPRLVRAQHRSRALGASPGLSGAARPHAGRRLEVAAAS